MKHGTPDTMKFRKLQTKLGESRRGTVGLLELLWIEVQKNCPDGGIGRFPDDEIAIMCDWAGEPERLVTALVDSGWLDPNPVHRLVVHDWDLHAPNYIKGNLAKHGKSFANSSSLPSTLPKQPTEEPAKQPAQSSEQPAISTVPPNLTQRNVTEPNETKPNDFGPEPPTADAGPTASPVILSFPVRGKPDKPWSLTEAKIAEYQETYPAIDAMSECRRAWQWLRDNPTQAKSQIPKFLSNWLAEEQDRGGRGRGRTVPPQPISRVATKADLENYTP